MTTATIDLPPKIAKVLSPIRGDARYRCLFGGRGSGKSVGMATVALVWGYAKPMRILCVREFQASIKESFYAELKAAVEMHPWLAEHYEFKDNSVVGANGTEFIFRGMRRNEQSIKSLAKIDLTIVEEAEDVPEGAWIALEATVFRQPKSEMWVIWNPKDENSPVDKRFRQFTPKGCLIAEVNYSDNPYFPDGLRILREQQEEMLDRDVYLHVWEGHYLKSVKGAYYAELIDKAKYENRIGFFPRHTMNKAYAIFDIGSTSNSADSTAIWIVQYVDEEIRWLNYYEAVGQEFAAHVNWLRSNGYDNAVCVLPHDGRKHDNVYHITPEKYLRQAGFQVDVVPNQGKGAAMQRVHALRPLFPHCRFNEETTKVGIDTLRYYHEKWDEKRDVGLGPEHDWSSHCADAAGLVAVYRESVVSASNWSAGPIRRNLKGIA